MLGGCGDNWPALKQCVVKLQGQIDFRCLHCTKCKLATEVAGCKLDKRYILLLLYSPTLMYACRRQRQLKNKVPDGFVVGKATGNGDCLFNAASTALFGDEHLCDLMRLASVFSAVEHFNHYCEMVYYARVN